MKDEWLFFSSRDDLIKIKVSNIMFFEADGNYTNIILTNKMRASVCMNLSAMEKVLAERLKENVTVFARIGKSYILNLRYVYQLNIQRKKLVMADFQTSTYSLELSKLALKKLKDMIIKIQI